MNRFIPRRDFIADWLAVLAEFAVIATIVASLAVIAIAVAPELSGGLASG